MEFWVLCQLRIGSLTCDAAFSFTSIILHFWILFEISQYSKLISCISTLLRLLRVFIHTLSSRWQWRNIYFPDGREFWVDRKASLSITLYLMLGLIDLLIESYCRQFSINGLFFHGAGVVYSWIRYVYARNDGIVDISLVFRRGLCVLNCDKALSDARRNGRKTFVKWITCWTFKNGVRRLNGLNYGRRLWILSKEEELMHDFLINSIFILLISDFRLFPDSRDFVGLVTCPWVAIKMWWAGHLPLVSIKMWWAGTRHLG